VAGNSLSIKRLSGGHLPPTFRMRRNLTLKRTAFTAIVVALITFTFVQGRAEAIGTAAVVGAVVAWSQHSVSRSVAVHLRFLPLMRVVAPMVAPLMAFAILSALVLLGILPLALIQVAILTLLGGLISLILLTAPGTPKAGQVRIGVVGSAATAADLRAELQARGNRSFLVVGHIRWTAQSEDAGGGESSEPLGVIGDLANTVLKERLDLLLIAPTVRRLSFFEEVEATCSNADVRILELAAFYERVFGHIALRAINAAWFQWVMHPRYSPRTPPSKRALDLCLASVVALLTAPLLAVFSLLIKAEGGPAFYRQTRIGEGGASFQILKLRTMRVADPGVPSRWSSANDDRVTGIGRFLRRTHLDELPQVVNVLRGDMSIVGPRPEQPAFVETLEESVAFYSRRHMVRPGITGWAQVRCGYAGSREGTLWKLSHDLYYLKHRSIGFDLLILGETLRTLAADRQFPTDLYLPPFVHSPADYSHQVPVHRDV
jgi:exopolysaccharide biosynthesis polyprenyl glycosylphosphotransferase